jgi:hypothetical protein
MTITRLIVSTIQNDPDGLVYKVNYEAKDGEIKGGILLLVYRYSGKVLTGSLLIGLDATKRVPVGVWFTKRQMMGDLGEKYSCPVREM